MSKTTIVILNWNGRAYLERFLPILIERTTDAEIIVADNASSDDSVNYMKQFYPEIRLIINDANYGFAGGYNTALKQIDADYYVLLNSDIEVGEHWFQPLLETMESDNTIAACQPKIMDYYNRNMFEYAGAAGGFIDKNGFPFCRGRIFNTLEEDTGQYDDFRDIFWASGACLVVRADVYHQLGGLDADFFAHMEEIDFCWRLHNHGKRVVFVPQSKVYHIGGGTLPKKSSRKTYLNFRNNYLLLYKNLPKGKIFITLTKRLFIDWIAAFTFLLHGNGGDFFAVIKAQTNTFFTLIKHKSKRKLNPSFSSKHIYQKSIIFEYHLRKKKRFSQLDVSMFGK